jgi:TatD DNase family protein
MTFTKDQSQLDMAKKVPLNRLLLETDAPYLAPKPMRGKVCKPEYVSATYDFLSELRGENKGALTRQVAKNAKDLFGI